MDFWSDYQFSVHCDPLEHLVTWTIGFISGVVASGVLTIAHYLLK